MNIFKNIYLCLIVICLIIATGNTKNNLPGSNTLNKTNKNKSLETNLIGTHIGQHTPDFNLKDLDGKYYNLKKFENKKVVLLDFWATWCKPCKHYMTETQSFNTLFSKRGLKVIAINVEGNANEVSHYIHSYNFTFTVLLDSGNWKAKTIQLFKINSIPTYILIDKKGIIRYNGHPDEMSTNIIAKYL